MIIAPDFKLATEQTTASRLSRLDYVLFRVRSIAERGKNSIMKINVEKFLLGAALALTSSITFAKGVLSSSPTSGIGYTTGAGGAVTQGTSKSTGVTLNTVTGAITLNNASLADDTTVTFTVTNSAAAATDVPTVVHKSAGTAGAYLVQAHSPASGSFKISVRNISGGTLNEAIVLQFNLNRGAIA
jgi:hypothetical protein